jgi:hypothetical protein
MERHINGGRMITRNCVVFKSNLRYDTDWRRFGTYFKKCVKGATPDDYYMQHYTRKQQVEMLVGYGHYCLTEHKPRPLAAATIAGSFSGLKHSFRSNFLDMDCFENKSLRAFKTATTLAERKFAAHNQMYTKDGRKAPMTLGMVHNVAMAAEGGSTAQVMCATAIQLAFFCLLRVSEYAPNVKDHEHDDCHALLARDVLFEVAVPGRRPVMLDATQVTAAMWPRVTLVKFTLRHMKNDQMRIGSTFWFRNLPPREDCINIVRVAFDWAVRARLQAGDYFMSYRDVTTQGKAKWLKYDTVNKAVKACAVRFNFRPEDFGTHSPRVGGACTLRAGDAPQTMVNHLGRWRTETSSWGYQEASMNEFDRMQRIIQDPTLFTTRDLQMVYDGTSRLAHSFLQRGG